MERNKNTRDTGGRYAHNMDAVCVCGHRKGDHSCGAPFDCLSFDIKGIENPCKEGECKAFKKARKLEKNY